jgi:hypothetical protein
MLPPTVFPFFKQSLHPNHPSSKQLTEEAATDATQMDVDAIASASEPDPSFFTDSFFEAATKTFQVCLLCFVSYTTIWSLPQAKLLRSHQGSSIFRVADTST